MMTKEEIEEILSLATERLNWLKKQMRTTDQDVSMTEQVRWATMSLLQAEADRIGARIYTLKLVLG